MVRTRDPLFLTLVIVSVSLGSLLAVQLARRVAFPWDLFIWSESPFLTNMLKLDSGIPVFTTPEDANSFVYSPGLEYLTYIFLKPFGLHLDIRFCRMISVLMGFAAALCAALCAYQIAESVRPHRPRLSSAFLSVCAASLVIFRNFTSDVSHPDNLFILHAVATLLLCNTAILQRRFWLAVVTMVFAGLGVLVKQPAALSFIGAFLALSWGGRWGFKRSAVLLLTGSLVASLSLAALFFPEYGRFYTLELLLEHNVRFTKLFHLVSHDIIQTPHRLFLTVAGAAAIIAGLQRREDRFRSLLTAWICLGLFGPLMTVPAYIKVMGAANNLVILDLWLLILVWPFLIPWAGKSTAHVQARSKAALDRFSFGRNLPILHRMRPAFPIVLLLTLFPRLFTPREAHFQYCESFEQLVRADAIAGRRPLVAHGTMMLIRSELTDVPLDRANSILELRQAGMAGLAGTARRIQDRYYDRIYLNSEWYGEELEAIIDANYRLLGTIPAPNTSLPSDLVPRDLMLEVRILEPKDAPSPE